MGTTDADETSLISHSKFGDVGHGKQGIKQQHSYVKVMQDSDDSKCQASFRSLFGSGMK